MEENATLYAYGIPVSNQNNFAEDMLINVEGMSANNVKEGFEELNTNLSNPYLINDNVSGTGENTTVSKTYTIPVDGTYEITARGNSHNGVAVAELTIYHNNNEICKGNDNGNCVAFTIIPCNAGDVIKIDFFACTILALYNGYKIVKIR